MRCGCGQDSPRSPKVEGRAKENMAVAGIDGKESATLIADVDVCGHGVWHLTIKVRGGPRYPGARRLERRVRFH